MEARLDDPDVLIVGAGVVGAALAYEISRRRQRVLVRVSIDKVGPTRAG